MAGDIGVLSRELAVDLLEAVLVRDRLLDEAFDADPRMAELSERDRGFVRMTVATTLRRLGQIDALVRRCLKEALPPRAGRVKAVLRLGAAQLLFLGTPAHAAISTSVELVKNTSHAGYAKLVNAVLRRLDREGRDWAAAQDAARLNTPDWLWESWVAAYGAKTARAVALANLGEAAVDFTLAGGDPAEWAEKLEAELLPTGSLRRLKGGDITRLPGYADGAWWVQDMAAALPARLLGEVKGLQVADLCAAPGGKALQLAAAGGIVTAVDRSAKRLKRFEDNLARMGLSATVVEAEVSAWTPPHPFDAVLLDAPCSATGTLRRHPDVARLKAPEDVIKLARTQAQLLKAAVAMTRPGGRMVYCVCSLQPEEGERQVEALLASGAPVRRVPMTAEEVGGLSELVTPSGDLRSLPCHLAERGGMDAFFAARLEKL